MEKQYAVSFGGKSVGKVLVNRRGLYYFFSCRCALEDQGIYRLTVSVDSFRENLGVLIPKEDMFVLDTKLPVKRIGEGDMSFFLVSKKEKPSGIFIPISPEEPFAYISRLKESFLVLRDGRPGICIMQNQEH